ncbi:helix-turn-helix transcriptional regulator [Paenibacillus cymbidii]|uniref:helix-turn-helix transcriptional regulator n=1 Tax=Paenibacillus cymbidii TaxID=1639034 RepID=UPI001F2F1F83|nr:AraC family transcriptional regulator [Paenibacillus cymbidii]
MTTMICLELPMPPMPQLLTVGHSLWHPGQQHFARRFDVYDLLIVKEGALYMSDERAAYEVGAGGLLALEPGVMHWGHKPCETLTEIYWVHFRHPAPLRSLPGDEVPWTHALRRGTDIDLNPSAQTLYVPKYAHIDLSGLLPVLDRMVEQHHHLTVENALELQAGLAQLLVKLQEAAGARRLSPSAALSARIEAYLRQHAEEPFDAEELANALHFHFDYLSRCLKRHTGLSPLQYVLRQRMAKARSLLERTELSVREIGEQVGMAETNYFIRAFRKQVGMPPAQYRKRMQESL